MAKEFIQAKGCSVVFYHLIKRVLLAVAQHRALHSAFGWGDRFGPPSILSSISLILQIAYPCEIQACQNVYRQEEEPEEAGAAAATGEDLCHPSQ